VIAKLEVSYFASGDDFSPTLLGDDGLIRQLSRHKKTANARKTICSTLFRYIWVRKRTLVPNDKTVEQNAFDGSVRQKHTPVTHRKNSNSYEGV